MCSLQSHNKDHGGLNDKNRHIGDLGNIASKTGKVNTIIRDKLK